MHGTLCYRHGYCIQGCDDCADLWQEIASTASPLWADKVVWPNLGSMNDLDKKRQQTALMDGSIVYGWRRNF